MNTFLASAAILILLALNPSARAQLRITEIMCNPSDAGGMPDAVYEFVEVQNTGTVTVNLQNWTIASFDQAVPAVLTTSYFPVAPGAVAVISNAGSVAFSAGYNRPVGPEFLSMNGRMALLRNAEDRITLRDGSGTIVCEQIFRSGTFGWPVNPEGTSLIFTRDAVTAGPEIVADGAYWANQPPPPDDASGTPNDGGGWASPGTLPQLAPGVIDGVRFTELMVSPARVPNTPPPGIEFVEIYNRSSVPANLQNWSISLDTTAQQPLTPFSFILPPGGYLVLGNVTAAQFNAVHNTSLPASGYINLAGGLPTLPDNGGELYLRDGNDLVRARITYNNNAGGWPAFGTGSSLTLGVPPASAGLAQFEDGASWRVQQPPILDLSSVLTDAGGYASPGAGFQAVVTTAEWDGGAAGDTRWSTAANWAGDAVPPAGATVVFRLGLTPSGVNLDGDRTVAAVICEAASGFSIGGGTLTITGGGVSVRMPNNPVTLDAPLVFTAPNAQVEATQYSQLILQGGISAPGDLTLTGGGTFPTGADVQCTGKFTFIGGTLHLLGREILAQEMALSGDALNGPGNLKCRGNLQYSGFVAVNGGPALYMLPAEVDMITTIAGAPLAGLSMFVKTGPGSTYLQAQVNTLDFDLAGGALDLYGDSSLRVSGTARLRAGATLYDIAGSGGTLLLRGNAQLINEGAEMFSEPSVGVSNALNETVTISGIPLTGLGSLTMAGGNQGTVMLSTDVTAQRLNLYGRVNLNDHTLTSTQPGWTVAFGGALIDSGSAGTLRIAGDFQSEGATFLGEPTLAMRPTEADPIINVQGSPLNDLGSLRVENTGSVVLRTFVNTRDFDLAGGSCDLYGNSYLRVSGSAWLRAGTTLYDIFGSGGHLLLRGNAQLYYEGAQMLFGPSLGISNGPGENVRLNGTAPLTGLGSLTMAGGNLGGVILNGMDVTAGRLVLSGTVDLNGQTLTSTAVGGVTTLTGVLADSGTGGTLRLSSTFESNNVQCVSEPALAIHPAAADQELEIRGNALSELGTLHVENAGTVTMQTRIRARNLDLSGGKLQLGDGATVEVLNGTARLGAGTVLSGQNSGSSVLFLLGASTLINEGVTLARMPSLSLRTDGQETMRLIGTSPLTSLHTVYISTYGQSRIQIEGMDITAQRLNLFSHTSILDLGGSTLTSLDAAADVILEGQIMDSGTGGTLQMAGNFINNHGTFSGEPSLKFTPGFFQFKSISGSPVFGLGRLTVAGDPVGMLTAGTSVSMRELDVSGGTFSLNNTSSTAVTERVWLRAGAALFSGGPLGSLGLFDNCRVENFGAVMDLKPGFFGFNSAGQTISFEGPEPLTDAGPLFKYGTGTLALHTPVSAEFCQLEGGTLDLCGKVHAFRGSPGGLTPESFSAAAGTVIRDSAAGGGLVLRHGLRNKGAAFEDTPDVTFDPPVFGNATIAGMPAQGLGRLMLATPGTVMQFSNIEAASLEIFGGEWRPHGAVLQVHGGVRLTGAGAIDRNFVSPDGTLQITGGDLDADTAGSVINVADLRISHPAGACRILGSCEVNALRVHKSGASTLDLNGHILFTHEAFTLERGLLRDESTAGGGRIQFLFPAPQLTRFNLQEGDVDVPVEGHPYWSKESAGVSILRGHLENSGDTFYAAEGTLRLDLDSAESFKTGSLALSPSTVLSGRGRITDGPVYVNQSSRIRPDGIPGAMSVAHLQLFSESILEVPLLNGAAPVKVPAGGSLTLPPVSPSACVLVKVTGTPMAGTTYDLFSWAGAVAGAPQLSQFQLHNSPPGHLKFNAAGDTLQFTATATGGWDAWRAANFTAAELADNSISGPAADPDADGLDNLAEYTLGALPKSADSADRFNTEDTLVNGIPALAIRFSASRTATDVFIEPETAVSLTDWEPASLDATGHKTDSAIEYVAWIPRNGDRRQLRVIFRR